MKAQTNKINYEQSQPHGWLIFYLLIRMHMGGLMTTNENGLVYQRILLKLSGEALAGADGFGIDPDRATDIALRVKEVHAMGV
jgi:hypothetical protein